MGMVYCSQAEVLVSWPGLSYSFPPEFLSSHEGIVGNSDDFNYRVWDINSRTIKFLLPLHSAMILRTIEVKSMGLMVSSSLDRYLSLLSTVFLSLPHEIPELSLCGPLRFSSNMTHPILKSFVMNSNRFLSQDRSMPFVHWLMLHIMS
jgi:hypothetical protein